MTFSFVMVASRVPQTPRRDVAVAGTMRLGRPTAQLLSVACFRDRTAVSGRGYGLEASSKSPTSQPLIASSPMRRVRVLLLYQACMSLFELSKKAVRRQLRIRRRGASIVHASLSLRSVVRLFFFRPAMLGILVAAPANIAASGSINAVSFSSARAMKRAAWRCSSAIEIVHEHSLLFGDWRRRVFATPAVSRFFSS